MRVTPLDIRKQEFRKVMRGLDSEEVYAFLQTVADEYEAVLSDNKKLRERMVELEDRLKEYKNIEMNLRNTLLTAEKITTEAKENARREASLIVREAEVEAEKAAEAIRAHTMQLRREILELKKQKDNYITRLKTLLESHRKVLEGFEEDFSEVDRAIEQIGEQVEMDIKQAVAPPRISRKKITEDTVTDPRDKVTWGDERKREDETRPSMPRPDWHGKQGPERGEDSPEGSANATKEGKAKAPSALMENVPPLSLDEIVRPSDSTQMQSSSGAVREDARLHLNTEPTGSVDHTHDTHADAGDLSADRRSGQESAGTDTLPGSGETRRVIEQSIVEKLYPEAPIGESGQPGSGPGNIHTSQDGSEEPRGTQPPHTPPTEQAPRVGDQGQARTTARTTGHTAQARKAEQPGTRTAVAEPEAEVESGLPRSGASAQVELKPSQDDWKHYEVRDQKPDWSSYEVPRSQKKLEKQAAPPTDNEVEEALAGLKDVSNALSQETEGDPPNQGMKNEAHPVARPATGIRADECEEPATAQSHGEASAPKAEQKTHSRDKVDKPKSTQAEDAVPDDRAVPGIDNRRESASMIEDTPPRGEQPAPESGENDDKKNSFWSMEQLRKNLSNFIGRDDEREEMRGDEREGARDGERDEKRDESRDEKRDEEGDGARDEERHEEREE